MFPKSSIKVAVDALSLTSEDTLIIGPGTIPFIPDILPYHNGAKFCIASGHQNINDLAEDIDQLMTDINLPSHSYLGLFSDDGLLETLSATSSLKLIDGVVNDDSPYDPVGTHFQAGNCVWELVQSQTTESVTTVLCVENMQDGRKPYRADMWPIFTFDDQGLSAVISFENFLDGWVFVWTGTRSTSIEMVEYFETDTKKGVSVSSADIFVNGWNYTPEHYFSAYIKATPVKLKDFASRITRGTSLSGKCLEKKGTIQERAEKQHEKRMHRLRKHKLVSLTALTLQPTLQDGSMYAVHDDDLFYLDSSSIGNDGTIIPEIIENMPTGQERYIVRPEDGTVLIIPRVGKSIALYNAPVPTLISNNLFIVLLNNGHINTDYLKYALNCDYVRKQVHQIISSSKTLGKKDVENIEVPIVPEKAQDAILECRRMQINRVVGLRRIIHALESVNAFQLWQEMSDESLPDMDRRIESMIRHYVESDDWGIFEAW